VHNVVHVHVHNVVTHTCAYVVNATAKRTAFSECYCIYMCIMLLIHVHNVVHVHVHAHVSVTTLHW